MTVNANIGNVVKKLREKSGLSQTQIAQFLSVDQSYISKCEKGERQFTVDMVEKLCNLFGCSISDVSGEVVPAGTLSIAFRADNIEIGDLAAIADINRIALNIGDMRRLLEI